MSLRFLTYSPKHWRNGTTFIGRSVCWFIGEERYDAIRVYKRTCYAEFWYYKQTYLHWLYTNKPEWANFLTLVPKPDSSHGFPYKETPSRYAQLSEDSLNSDGFSNWYTYLGVSIAALWNAYIYFWPRRWVESYDFLADVDLERLDAIDAYAGIGFDQTITYWFDWSTAMPPHKFQWFRKNQAWHFIPESRFQSVGLTLNKKNLLFDHHWRGLGNDSSMT